MHLRKTLLAFSFGSFGGLAYAEPASQEFLPLTRKDNAQAASLGLLEGQTLGGTTRNWYGNELGRRDTRFSYDKHGVATDTSRRINWVQGTIVKYESGFTQGTVGISTELAVYNAVALNRSRRDIAGGDHFRTLTDDEGEAVGQWSKLGLGNIKARVSNTTLTAGRQNLNTPMVASSGNRALPSSFQGVALNSAEFDNLSFDMGTFDRVSPRSEQGLSQFTSEYGNRNVSADHVNTLGVNYQPLKSLTASLYATQAQDLWNQYYFGAVHQLGDNDVLGLTTSLNYYKTKNQGKSLLGPIDNNTYSLAFTGTHKAHSVTLAYQQVNGNEYFDYLHETNGIFLANSLFSDFNGPNEKSLQLAYGLNMAEYGAPGLKFDAYHARGWGIDGTHYKGTGYSGVTAMNGESHYEYGIGMSYAMQSGTFKDTTVRATYATHRASANQADGNLNEFRFVTTVPFNIL